MIYLVALLLSYILAGNVLGKTKMQTYRNRNVALKYFWAVLPFLFITVLRFDVGTDYMQYLYGYYHQGIGESRERERVFQYLIDLSHYLNFPFLMITLFGTMVCLMTFYWIYKLSDNIKESILLFFLTGFFLLSLTMMRQSAVTALFFIAMIFLLKRKYFFYFVLTVLCYLLHSTGAIYIMLGCVFILMDKMGYSLNFLKPKFLICMAVLVFFSGNTFRELLMQVAHETQTYVGYFNSDQDAQNTSITFLIFGITPFISYLFAHFKPCGLAEAVRWRRMEYIIFTVMCWLSMVTGLLRPLIPNGERIVFLFEPVAIVSVPFFVGLTQQKYKKMSLYISYIGFGLCVFWYYYIKRSLDMFPYHFIFIPDINIW